MSITMFLLDSSPPREIQFMIQDMITFVLNNNAVADFVAQYYVLTAKQLLISCECFNRLLEHRVFMNEPRL